MTIMTSVVVASFNGSERIGCLIASLLPSLSPARELIVIDDGSRDGTAAIARDCAGSHSNISCYTISNGGRAAARNAGARKARGGLIIFIDDDIEVLPSFIERHEQIHHLHPGAWVTGTVRQKIIDIAHRDFLLFRQRLDYRADAVAGPSDLVRVDSFSTQQLSVKASVFWECGGFDERLRDFEDFELSVRAQDLGFYVIHDRANIVYHRDFSTFQSFIKRQIEYRNGRKRLFDIRPDLSERFKEADPSRKRRSFIELIIRKIFRLNSAWNCFFQCRIRLLIPRKVLYLMYDLVCSSTVILSVDPSEAP